MSATHTPGNWIFEDKGDRFEIMSGTTPGRDWVATVHGGSDHDEPNAKLITAAPDLLAALEKIIGEIDARSMGRLEGDSKFVQFVDAGRAAIAKATGA